MGTKIVLFVEDDHFERKYIIDAIEKSDGIAQMARSGLEAEDWLKSNPTKTPHLIVLDLRMESGDGLVTLKTLRKDDRLRCVPIVVLTASSNQEDIRSCWLHGASAYYVKEYDVVKHDKLLKDIMCHWLKLNHTPARL